MEYLCITPGRMGNIKQALQLITDVDQAIDFCKEHNDYELWEDLIKYSLDKPSKYRALLKLQQSMFINCSC